MKSTIKQDVSAKAAESTTSFQGNVCRQNGDMRAVTMKDRQLNHHEMFGVTKTLREVFDTSFSKHFDNSR